MKKYLLCCVVLCCVFTSCKGNGNSGSGNSPSRSVASTDQSSILPDSSEKFNHGVQDATEAVSMFTLKKGDTLSITPISLSDDKQHITISFGNGTVTKQLTLKVLVGKYAVIELLHCYTLKINGTAEDFVGQMENEEPLYAFTYVSPDPKTYYIVFAIDNKILYNSKGYGYNEIMPLSSTSAGWLPPESYRVTTASQEYTKTLAHIKVGDYFLEKVK